MTNDYDDDWRHTLIGHVGRGRGHGHGSVLLP